MTHDLIKIESKVLRYCLKKINRIDLANNLDYLSEKDIHEVYTTLLKYYKEEKKCLNVQNKC